MNRYKTSINLVVYNGSPWLPWCLESISNQTYKDFFLLIIDNGSIDNSYDICSNFLQNHPQLAVHSRIIKNKTNIGFARGHNQALAWTESDYVLVLNQDVYLIPDYLELLVASVERQETTAAISGKLLTWQFDSSSWHVSNLNQQSHQIIDSMGLQIKRSRRVINLNQGEVDTGKWSQAIRVFGVAGTAPLYRRQSLLTVSPSGEIFDEDFVSYKEDIDIAWRLQLAGFNSWVEPKAVAYHDRSLSSGRRWRDEYNLRRRRAQDLKIYSWANHLAVLIKNDGILNFLLDLPWFFTYEFGKIIFMLLTDPITLFKAYLRFLKLLPRFIKKRGILKSTRRLAYKDLRYWWIKPKVAKEII